MKKEVPLFRVISPMVGEMVMDRSRDIMEHELGFFVPLTTGSFIFMEKDEWDKAGNIPEVALGMRDVPWVSVCVHKHPVFPGRLLDDAWPVEDPSPFWYELGHGYAY